MTENYTPETLEKGARALFAEEQCDRRQREDVEGNWNARLAPEDQDEYRSLARAVLDAVAGDIAARALEDVADTFLWAGDDEDYQAFRALLRDRAARLREGGDRG
jgi:hypothetical protein